MVVCFIAFRWIHLSTPVIMLCLLVLILFLLPTLNFLPVWFALSVLRFRLPSRLPMRFIFWMVAMMVVIISSFFFFQAEDGIRDLIVTGVQTCALPISARETATLVPRLLGEASALAGALPAGTATAVSGTLERFAARAQRLQLDVSTLTQGTGDARQAAQRIAEGSDYLGQVITGLMGGNSALALPRVTTPEPARHLKALDGIYTDLSAAVRRAVAAAPALPAARTASRAIEMDARELAGTASPATIGGVLAWAPLVLLAAGLGEPPSGPGGCLRRG